jgi:hypothetical protein
MSDPHLSLVRTCEHTLRMWTKLQQELDQELQRQIKPKPELSQSARRMGIALNDMRIALLPLQRLYSYSGGAPDTYSDDPDEVPF